MLLYALACSMAGQWDTPTGEDPVETKETSDTAGDPALPELELTELMVDPGVVSDDVGEWFELHNLSAESADLAGVGVTIDGDDGFVVDRSVVLDGGGYLVFASSDDPTENGGVVPDYTYSIDDLKLSNEGGTLALSLGDTELGSVDWSGWPDAEGRSASFDGSTWCAATSTFGAGDRGTPAAANDACVADDYDGDGAPDADDCDPADDSVHPGAPELEDGVDQDCDGVVDERPPAEGELVIDEVMDDPDPTDDDFGEWFEVTNVADVSLDLTGLVLSDEGGESTTIVDGVVVAPGALLVFGASADTSVNGGHTPDVLFDDTAFHLSNDEDQVLLGLGDVIVDEVAYDNDFPHEKGKTRSLDPDHVDAEDNDAAKHWCEGDGDYGTDGNQGTPGAANDEC